MARQLDETDTRLLQVLQEEVPLVERPYAAIAERLGLSHSEVLARAAMLKSRPHNVIRQISAIFDSKALGYRSTLVAARVDEEDLEKAIAVINAHPGVSHNYLRTHDYNVWYTLAVPPDSLLGLEATVDRLHRLSGARATRMLPTLKLFKIGVRLDLAGESESPARVEPAGYTDAEREQALQYPITESDKQMIRILQQDLSVETRPFHVWAEQGGVSARDLLEAGNTYLRRRQMRRFAAVLKHREVGFSANAMGVWAVQQSQAEAFGRIAASFAAVSHCYLRPSYPDWPYSIFTMVHAPTQDQCEEVLASISTATGVGDYAALYSTREFKKTRVKYFLGDIGTWEWEQRSPSCTCRARLVAGM